MIEEEFPRPQPTILGEGLGEPERARAPRDDGHLVDRAGVGKELDQEGVSSLVVRDPEALRVRDVHSLAGESGEDPVQRLLKIL